MDRGEAVRALQEAVEAAEVRRAALHQQLLAQQELAHQADADAVAAKQQQRATQSVRIIHPVVRKAV